MFNTFAKTMDRRFKLPKSGDFGSLKPVGEGIDMLRWIFYPPA